MSDMTWVLVTLTGAGSGVGATMGLFNIIIVKFMGREQLAPVYGASGLVMAIGFVITGPAVGKTSPESKNVTVSLLRPVSSTLWVRSLCTPILKVSESGFKRITVITPICS